MADELIKTLPVPNDFKVRISDDERFIGIRFATMLEGEHGDYKASIEFPVPVDMAMALLAVLQETKDKYLLSIPPVDIQPCIYPKKLS